MGWYYEHAGQLRPDVRRASGSTPTASPALGNDPRWAKLLKWQKKLVDWYGYDKLVKFQAGLGDEFSASNAFENGKLAMNIDGEWRTAFIADEAPNLNYGTAPFPVDDSQPGLYGGGYMTGNIVGIPKRAEHPEQGWELLKYLATDNKAHGAALQRAAQRADHRVVGEVARTSSRDPKFADVPEDLPEPDTTTTPVTAAGSADQELFNSFINKWQAGRVSDLAGRPRGRRQADRRPARERRGRAPVP